MLRSKISISLLIGVALIVTAILIRSYIGSSTANIGEAVSTLENPAISFEQEASATTVAATSTETTAKVPNSSVTTYNAALKSGIIGSYDGRQIDNPADNIFTVVLDRSFNSSDRVFLQYELTGVKGVSGVAHSINDRLSTGGYLVHLSDSTTLQREQLNPLWLVKGANRILFSVPDGATYGYKISNLAIVVEKGTADKQSDTFVITANEIYGNKAYIHGYLTASLSANEAITIAGNKIPVIDGEFETVVAVPDNYTVSIIASNADGTVKAEKNLTFNQNLSLDKEFAFINKEIQTIAKTIKKGKQDSLILGNTVLKLTQGALLATKNISITGLRSVDMPPLDMGMINVTDNNDGYRFLPHGKHFTDGATVSLKYDRTKIPSGYTENDIHTYYFDNNTRHWVALERDTIDRQLSMVVSRTTHFTDMINGIIQTPESPETQGFAPTMMTDIKAADPTAKIEVIAPPTANNRGTANLSYTFEMPPARNGMQPQLGLRYNSDGGSGWCGEGWDINLPSISVDTRWGVPRYNNDIETETYLMDGEMLVTMDDNEQPSVAHRGDKINRIANRQFYPRSEGTFSRIIRKGNSPSNYTWEVTDKSGTVYTYGGAGATLSGTVTTIDGQQKTVIVRWMLKKVVELHGDYIEYSYNTVDEPVVGSLTAKAIYLSSVSAGNREHARPHTEVTFTNGADKAKKTNNARYGFLTSSNKLLDKVTVSFFDFKKNTTLDTLRSYGFTYKQGAFFTDVLDSVTHFNNNGNAEASHRFDYYDDVKSNEGYEPFGPEEDWTDTPSVLSKSSTTSVGASTYGGVGIFYGDKLTKGGTVGVNFSYSNSNTDGEETYIDINGDGLPDRVFRSRNGLNYYLYYQPNLMGNENANRNFGDPIMIENISRFSKVKSSSTTVGGSANLGFYEATVSAGISRTYSSTKTSIYFADMNNDGLVDLVSDGKVYFNHIRKDAQGNLIPVFTSSSADTPSPIKSGGIIDISDTEVDPLEQDTLIINSPLYDVVRVWEAPFKGKIKIEGAVQLLAPQIGYDPSDYEKADGVRVAIQVKGVERWSQKIEKDDFTIYSANITLTDSIQKGDKIFFRLQSGDERMANGAFDKVTWSPVITYIDGSNIILSNTVNPDGQKIYQFPAAEANIHSQSGATYVAEYDSIILSGTFEKGITSDNVTLKVVQANDGLTQNRVIYEREFAYDEIFPEGDLTINVPNDFKEPNFYFYIESTTNVDWTKVKWKPYLQTDSNDYIIPAAVDYSIYRQVMVGRQYITAEDSVELSIIPRIELFPRTIFEPKANGEIVVSVKNKTGLLYKDTIIITEGVVSADTIPLLVAEPDTVWIEAYTQDIGLLTEIISIDVKIDTAGITVDSLLINLFALSSDRGFGRMYRNWGQFVYNAAEGRYAQPIYENALELPNDTAVRIDPRTTIFFPMSLDIHTKSYWAGGDNEVYIRDTEMSASRLGEKDVILTNPLAGFAADFELTGSCIMGGGASGVDIRAEGKSTNETEGASFGVGINYSYSKGDEKTTLSFSDMNGDGYPDIISKNKIQYTNTLGGFDGEIASVSGNQGSESESKSWGLGGDPITAHSILTRKGKGAENDGSGKSANNAALSSVNISYSQPEASDWVKHTLMDVNGDGLPDKVFEGGEVRINLGYGFSAPVGWDISDIQKGETETKSGGLDLGVSWGDVIERLPDGTGKTVGSSSISFGVSVSSSTSTNKFSFVDVNGDGLADKVRIVNGKAMVSFNNGVSFEPEIEWKHLSTTNKLASSGTNVNVAYTYNIIIPLLPPPLALKIPLNVGANGGTTKSYTLAELRDVDGDGYPDMVWVGNDGKLKIRRSTIARTNKLKTVHNPFGGSFTLDYKHTQPTYDHPGGKWALSAVEINHDIPNIPDEYKQGEKMRTEFDYAEGKHDRHEREFLGFGKVITKSVDTEDNNALYRSITETYDVSNYYAKGNLLSTVLTNTQGNKYTKSVNEYYSYEMTAVADTYRFTPNNAICSDRAISFSPLRYTHTMMYEGQTDSIIVEASHYKYKVNNGDFGELERYRFSDKGTLAADGSGSFNYETNITYTGNPAKHIFGLPVTVQVKDGNGNLYRNIRAAYDLNYANHLTQVSQQLNDNNEWAETYIQYDINNGNIIKKTLPPQQNGGVGFSYEYIYEQHYNMYVSEVVDALLHRSYLRDYDYRYGIPRETQDINGNISITELDDLGRIKTITGPIEFDDNDINNSTNKTIKFKYNNISNAGYWYAVTTHHDSQHPNEFAVGIRTVTFVDGIGRPIQVMKTGMLTEQDVNNPTPVMIVSGRVKYDPYGRVREAYYPVTARIPNNNDSLRFNTIFDSITPTKTTYDILDRTLTTTLPNSSITEMEYGLDTDTYTMVTTVTDAEGGKQTTYTNGSKLTLKTEQYSGLDTITTKFAYDAINRLLTVIDNDNNVTSSTYDMGGRRTKVVHPVSGTTTFTYNLVGSMTEKQTENLKAVSEFIEYKYDEKNRLTDIIYPNNTENNVKYTYGGRGTPVKGGKGRLILQEDGTGAQAFEYGAQGELTKVTRTIVIPNQAITTYVTEWTYDSWNRLRNMTYPDGETVIYDYNKAGLLDRVWSDKNEYIAKIGYDKFEQRIYMKYGNDAETYYKYDSLRRLSNLTVNTAVDGQIMNNNYSYDRVDNVLSVTNMVPLPSGDGIGGQMIHNYEYDGLYRLTSATGTYRGAGTKEASYSLSMTYDNMHRITHKKQDVRQTDVQFAGILRAGYELTYHYDNNPFQISTLEDNTYRTDSDSTAIKNSRQHSYDGNGNLISIVTAMDNKSGTVEKVNIRELKWDEENRLLAINDNGFVSQYWYDADGERVIKKSGYGEGIYVNGVYSGGITDDKFTAYVNPYLVVTNGFNYTKHIYIGSQRIVSKLGNLTDYKKDQWTDNKAGTGIRPVSYDTKYSKSFDRICDTYRTFEVPYDSAYNKKAAITDCPRVEGQVAISDSLLYFYHSDHLGSSSLITNIDGEKVQHIEYIPFGEVFIDERKGTWNTPYLFNAKELDEETGLYYYGARYYDPRVSVWLSADPMQEKYPHISTYAYCLNNPVIYIDPDGREAAFGFNYTMRFGKGLPNEHSASVSAGTSSKLNSSTMVSNIISANVYNSGLGTTQGRYQGDLIFNASLTSGTGQGASMPFNIFNNNTATSIGNDFLHSGTIGFSSIWNTDGRNQRVGNFGFKTGDISFNNYNDVYSLFGLGGDGNDRWWTAGYTLQQKGGFFIGGDVFTGERMGEPGNFLFNPANTAGGRCGTYQQNPYDISLNNGQTILKSQEGTTIMRGKSQMWPQNIVHDARCIPRFESTASDVKFRQ